MKLKIEEFESKMKKSVSAYSDNLATIRAGRANPEILARVTADYYGAPTPISQMAEIRAADARTLVISPYDPSSLKQIERAILTSDVGITPQSDGKLIRLAVPPLNEERRRELKKQVEKLGEDAKVAIRNIRRDAMERTKAMKKASEMTEDEQKLSEKDIQTLTDKYIKEIDNVTDNKVKEIMSV